MIVIGRTDRIDLPLLGLDDIAAKVDTGAYGSALHCHKIKVVRKKNGTHVLTYQVLDPGHPEYEDKTFRTRTFDDTVVRNSGGQTEHRYTIKTDLIIFGRKRKIEFSLTDRKQMKHPVLLGREFLYKRFMVDVTKKDLSFNSKKDKK